MRESIGSTFLYNLIILFIAIVFAILGSTLMYYKAFKVNTRIINSIEKFEGYNDPAKTEINNNLTSIGYMAKDTHTCPNQKNGGILQTENKKFRYCVYYFEEGNEYYKYGIVTYITLDIPIVNMFVQIPIYSESDRIYKFNA